MPTQTVWLSGRASWLYQSLLRQNGGGSRHHFRFSRSREGVAASGGVRSVFIPLSREILRPPPCRCNLPDEGRRIADGSWSELATPGFRQHPANPVVTEIARSVDRCVALLAKTQGWFVLYPEAITVHCKYGFEDGRPSGPGVPMIPSPARFAGFRSSLIVEMFYNRGTFPLCWRSCHPVGG